jgi:hypothetical protein
MLCSPHSATTPPLPPLSTNDSERTGSTRQAWRRMRRRARTSHVWEVQGLGYGEQEGHVTEQRKREKKKKKKKKKEEEEGMHHKKALVNLRLEKQSHFLGICSFQVVNLEEVVLC